MSRSLSRACALSISPSGMCEALASPRPSVVVASCATTARGAPCRRRSLPRAPSSCASSDTAALCASFFSCSSSCRRARAVPWSSPMLLPSAAVAMAMRFAAAACWGCSPKVAAVPPWRCSAGTSRANTVAASARARITQTAGSFVVAPPAAPPRRLAKPGLPPRRAPAAVPLRSCCWLSAAPLPLLRLPRAFFFFPALGGIVRRVADFAVTSRWRDAHRQTRGARLRK
mmetsp:Transcript_10822/g.39697  ORF Transcript_10822/g.39697 Transcript_10822/m.39697 type:complete len:229 (-) Transcript_10822:155-841(-)